MTSDHSFEVPRRYVEALDAAGDALYIAGSDGSFEMVNEELLELTGYERATLLGANPCVLLHDDDIDGFDQHLQIVREDATADSDTLFVRIVTNHGTEVPVELELTALTVDGDYDGHVTRVRDVRQQTQQEQKLNILNRALRHNIRNRMNLVVAHAATLQEVDDPNYRTAAETIESVGKEVINISDKARKAQDHLDIPPDQDCRADLVAMTDHVVDKFAIKYPDASITTTLPKRARALAPPSYEVALVELVENAIVHHPSGSGPVDIEIIADDGTVTVHVRDDCDPLPDGVVDTVQRGEEDPLKHNEGLGLWIVRWVVDSVRGELVFDRRDDDSGNDVMLRFDALTES